MYEVVGSGESNHAGKQSNLDRRDDEHLQPHDSVGTGGGPIAGPVKVAEGGEGSCVGRARYGTVDGQAVGGQAVEGPARSDASMYCCPNASKPQP